MCSSTTARQNRRISRWLRSATVLVGLAACVACGGDSSPTAPSPVTPNFAGTWSGSVRTQQCTPPSTSPALCQGTIGTETPAQFVLTQGGTGVSGTIAVGGEPVPVSGSVATGAPTTLAGRLTLQNGSTVTVDTQLTVAGTAMTGTATYSLTLNATSGTLTVVTALQNVVRR